MTEAKKTPIEGGGQPMCLHQEKRILTSREAARHIDVSMAQLYRLTSNKQIPFYSPTGGKLYFNRTELDDWMLSNRISTVQEIQISAINYQTK